jgi:hypothetical protein
MGSLHSSFRDRDGFVFERDGRILRQVNSAYAPIYRKLTSSGFFERLWERGALIPHRELRPASGDQQGLVLEPEQIETVLYPYEWCFGQWKEAALVTLDIQRAAIAGGFSLKDASAYNIQFHGGRACLIDTLSFEPYTEGKPWVAYRQFCQHFLAPLALMAHRDTRLGLLLRNHIDGVPLDLASRLLPRRTWLNFGLLFHVHLHARAQSRFQNRDRKVQARSVSRNGLLGILQNLESTVRGLHWQPAGTEWGCYYKITNYEQQARDDKSAAIETWLGRLRPGRVWDLGANDGTFSRLAVRHGALTVAWDIDPAAVEKAYRANRAMQEKNLLPAVLDLTNPSPALGWNLEERSSLFERRLPDLTLALALLHHLAIGNNVPLARCAAFFRRISPQLIIEWVPKSDSKVAELLRNRQDVFTDYTEQSFLSAFGEYYGVIERRPVAKSHRVLFLLQAK